MIPNVLIEPGGFRCDDRLPAGARGDRGEGMKLVERFDAHWCCGRCGVESVGKKQPKDADMSKFHNSENCWAWGVSYGKGQHIWDWWERSPLLDKPRTTSATGHTRAGGRRSKDESADA